MPYKDPVKAALQKQRWEETHPEWRKAYQRRREKKLKRWLTPKRRAQQKRWRKDNPAKTSMYGLHRRIYHAESVKASRTKDYRKHKAQYKARAHARYKVKKTEILEKTKRYADGHRVQLNEARRNRYLKNVVTARKKGRAAALKSYYRHQALNQQEKN